MDVRIPWKKQPWLKKIINNNELNNYTKRQLRVNTFLIINF